MTFGKKEQTKDKLGKDFDKKVQDVAIHAKNGGVAFGFWNLDHLECFDLTELVPIYDEDDGGLKAGIRFGQIDDSKPLRATLYELDGYTDYIKRKDEDVDILHHFVKILAKLVFVGVIFECHTIAQQIGNRLGGEVVVPIRCNLVIG